MLEALLDGLGDSAELLDGMMVLEPLLEREPEEEPETDLVGKAEMEAVELGAGETEEE